VPVEDVFAGRGTVVTADWSVAAGRGTKIIK
jgi:hypothetical protein